MTPGEAIRKHCVDCVGSTYETKNCGGQLLLGADKPCPLFSYRQGERRPSVKVIRKECLSCMNGQSAFVKNCPSTTCNLYPFRLGKNPNHRMTEKRLEQLCRMRKKSHDG